MVSILPQNSEMIIVEEMMKRLVSNPLPLMKKPTPTQIQAAETSTAEFKEEEEDIIEPTVDQVYCWWMEMPEMQKTAICIRKTPNVKFSVSFVNEFQVEIRSTAVLSDPEIVEIGRALGIPKEFVVHNWTPQHKDTLIVLNSAIMNSPSEVFKSEYLVVITFPMKKESSVEF
jgi:hypothetical protein